jgi:hypothetical protein
VQQLLGTFDSQERFGLGLSAYRSIGGRFSPLSFYIEEHFTSSPHGSPHRTSLGTPPSPLIVSALYLTRISNQVL